MTWPIYSNSRQRQSPGPHPKTTHGITISITVWANITRKAGSTTFQPCSRILELNNDFRSPAPHLRRFDISGIQAFTTRKELSASASDGESQRHQAHLVREGINHHNLGRRCFAWRDTNVLPAFVHVVFYIFTCMIRFHRPVESGVLRCTCSRCANSGLVGNHAISGAAPVAFYGRHRYPIVGTETTWKGVFTHVC